MKLLLSGHASCSYVVPFQVQDSADGSGSAEIKEITYDGTEVKDEQQRKEEEEALQKVCLDEFDGLMMCQDRTVPFWVSVETWEDIFVALVVDMDPCACDERSVFELGLSLETLKRCPFRNMTNDSMGRQDAPEQEAI